jgi:NAD(P)-dependent dehydrogenase (short-subunit alcohol dehydrogenase family)
MVADINEEGAKDVAAGIRAQGGSAAVVMCDITNEDAVRGAVDATAAEFGRLDGLITSPGVGGAPGPGDRWDRSLEMLLKGPFYACKYALQQMERDGSGAIVNISSLAGVTGSIATSIDDTGYPCAKHGVIGLTRTLALAYAQKNIRVNAICPGYIRTALTRPLYDTEDGGQSLITEQLRVPMGRWGEATEIATVAAFLLSDEASYITGQPIIVDGGFMAR